MLCDGRTQGSQSNLGLLLFLESTDILQIHSVLDDRPDGFSRNVQTSEECSRGGVEFYEVSMSPCSRW